MRKSILYGLAILGLLFLCGGTALYFYVKGFNSRARDRVIQALQERFDADVDLKSLDVSLYPKPRAIGEGLSIRHKGWTDPHPLIYIRRFTARTDFDTLIDRKNHVTFLRLEGLEIHIPPRGRSVLEQGLEQNHEVASAEPGQDTTSLRFLIDTIVADGTLLEIDPKIEGKPPLRFEIEKLTLQPVGPGQPMLYKASLTNAKPPGLMGSTGRFGPWQRDDPRATAVSGNYNFSNADLAVFKGISGTLSSTGSYHGVLQHIEVDGTTDTPNFALKRGSERVHLATKFHSVVNGTDGDTILDPVDAQFRHSEFICRGGIVHLAGGQGKTVSLDAVTTHARMEDILTLVMGTKKPILTGAVDFKTKILIPPGHQEVLDKLNLDGQFALSSAEFTSPKIEQRLQSLSNRARGISKKEEEESPETVASDLYGKFKLEDGLTTFSTLSFSVPGAAIRLAGKYNLRSEQIDMAGQFRMQATLSQTQSGIKHWALKPFDRFFEKNGAGFELPITISGTKAHPEVGTEIFHRKITIH
ncbi:MAG: AsmA-like C-terminal region-containing protein [Bryobacteraceae bacterium]